MRIVRLHICIIEHIGIVHAHKISGIHHIAVFFPFFQVAALPERSFFHEMHIGIIARSFKIAYCPRRLWNVSAPFFEYDITVAHVEEAYILKRTERRIVVRLTNFNSSYLVSGGDFLVSGKEGARMKRLFFKKVFNIYIKRLCNLIKLSYGDIIFTAFYLINVLP